MTFEELLKACSTGELPRVQFYDLNGRVTVIKDNEGFKGCGVKFSKMPYDTWFYAEDGNDGRKKYMKDLILL